jgi:hypothetical protein
MCGVNAADPSARRTLAPRNGNRALRRCSSRTDAGKSNSWFPTAIASWPMRFIASMSDLARKTFASGGPGINVAAGEDRYFGAAGRGLFADLPHERRQRREPEVVVPVRHELTVVIVGVKLDEPLNPDGGGKIRRVSTRIIEDL